MKLNVLFFVLLCIVNTGKNKSMLFIAHDRFAALTTEVPISTIYSDLYNDI